MSDQTNHNGAPELRSEKVRSIIGEIPSSLERYGITAIALVLLCLLGISYMIPYKQVYSGTAVIYDDPPVAGDSTEVVLRLRFEGYRPSNLSGQPIEVVTGEIAAEGLLLDLSARRDTLERQEARCRFASSDIVSLTNQSADFRIVHTSGSLLRAMLGSPIP